MGGRAGHDHRRLVDVLPLQKSVHLPARPRPRRSPHTFLPLSVGTTECGVTIVASLTVLLGFISGCHLSLAPWELYHSSLHHVLLDPTPSSPSFPNKDPSPQALLARTALLRLHTFYLLLTLLAPIFGACLLSFTRHTLTEGDRYVNTFSIRLFLIASAIKPVTNLVDLLKGRNAALKKIVGRVADSEGQRLDRRLAMLERELVDLRDREKNLASRGDVEQLRAEVVGGQLGDLAKAVRRGERRGELVRLTLSEVSAPRTLASCVALADSRI